jgi:glycine cleavage system H protein
VDVIPENLRYTAEHEWVAAGDGPVRVGITDFAQDALGDIVYVQLPEPGTEVAAGDAFGEVESTKSVSEIYAPVSGRVTARNEALVDSPDLINTDPTARGGSSSWSPATPRRWSPCSTRTATPSSPRADLPARPVDPFLYGWLRSHNPSYPAAHPVRVSRRPSTPTRW